MVKLFFVCISLFSLVSASNQNNLDNHLKKNSINKIEGHIKSKGSQQPEFLKKIILENPNIIRIAEVGFNAGHSSELFLSARSNINVTSFDICSHHYVKYGKDFIDKTYPGRHTLVKGPSSKTIPNFFSMNPDTRYDLIFIDGGHTYTQALEDIVNMQKLAHDKTIVIMDDIKYAAVAKAWHQAVLDGMVRESTVVSFPGKKIALGYYIGTH